MARVLPIAGSRASGRVCRLHRPVVGQDVTSGAHEVFVDNHSLRCGAHRLMATVRSCYDSRCLTDITKAGFNLPEVNCKSLHSNNVRSCLASLENALKACVDAVIASTSAFVPDLS